MKQTHINNVFTTLHVGLLIGQDIYTKLTLQKTNKYKINEKLLYYKQ